MNKWQHFSYRYFDIPNLSSAAKCDRTLRTQHRVVFVGESEYKSHGERERESMRERLIVQSAPMAPNMGQSQGRSAVDSVGTVLRGRESS